MQAETQKEYDIFKCPVCGGRIQGEGNQTGDRIQCSGCKTFFIFDGCELHQESKKIMGNDATLCPVKQVGCEVTEKAAPMWCPECGKRIEKSIKMCPGCGYPFEENPIINSIESLSNGLSVNEVTEKEEKSTDKESEESISCIRKIILAIRALCETVFESEIFKKCMCGVFAWIVGVIIIVAILLAYMYFDTKNECDEIFDKNACLCGIYVDNYRFLDSDDLTEYIFDEYVTVNWYVVFFSVEREEFEYYSHNDNMARCLIASAFSRVYGEEDNEEDDE